MKKTLLLTTMIICGMMVTGTAFSQHTQSLSFVPSGGGIYHQNDTFTVDVSLTFAGYSAYALTYWLETLAGTQSFFHITKLDHLVFNYGYTGPTDFVYCNNSYCATKVDLGATTQPLTLVPPGTYLISHIRFSVTNAAPGVYTFYTTTGNPRPSIVTDQNFNDNAIPQASFSITIVP